MLVGNVYESKYTLTLYKVKEVDGEYEILTNVVICPGEVVTCLEFDDSKDMGNSFYFKLLYKGEIYVYRAVNSVFYDVNSLIEKYWSEVC